MVIFPKDPDDFLVACVARVAAPTSEIEVLAYNATLSACEKAGKNDAFCTGTCGKNMF